MGPSLSFRLLAPATEFGQRSAPVDGLAGEDRHDKAGDGRGRKQIKEEDGGDGEGDTPAGWLGMLSGRGAHSFFVFVAVVLLCCCLLCCTFSA